MLNANVSALKNGLTDLATSDKTPAQLRRMIRTQEKQLAKWQHNPDVAANMRDTLNSYKQALADRLGPTPERLPGSVKELREYLREGVTIKFVWRAVEWDGTPRVFTVARVQNNAVAFSCEAYSAMGLYWHHFTKVSDYVFDATGFDFYREGIKRSRYEF